MATELVSPRQAARAIGVSESSLKRWCDQGLLATVRTAGGHRKLPPAEIVRFARERFRPLLVPDAIGLPLASQRSASNLHDMREPLTEALLSGNEATARQIVFDLYLAKHPMSIICDEVIAGAFRDIGERWACREADVYHERRGCEIVLRIIHELRRCQTLTVSAPTAIGSTIEGNYYSLPSAMAELVLRDVGFQATSLGLSIPFRSMALAVEELQPKLFWLGVSHIPEGFDFAKEFAPLSQACSAAGTALVVGGRALTDELRRRLVYAAYCDTMQQMESFARVVRKPPKRHRASSHTARRSQRSK